MNNSFIERKYKEFIEKNGYIPEMFNPYNCAEITDIAPTQTAHCGGITHSSTVLIIEDDGMNKYEVSQKGVRFITAPKRGMATDINPEISMPLTAKGQTNWTGSFISPDIDYLEKSTTLGSKEPVKIVMKDGEILMNDGTKITDAEGNERCNLRIRKLTPKECFRLMGFDDEDFEKAEKVNSNSQLYKQAGNSIVVDVLEEIFCMMLDDNGEIYV